MLMVSFAMQKLTSLIRFRLFIFAFISSPLGNWPMKTLLWFVDFCEFGDLFSCVIQWVTIPYYYCLFQSSESQVWLVGAPSSWFLYLLTCLSLPLQSWSLYLWRETEMLTYTNTSASIFSWVSVCPKCGGPASIFIPVQHHQVHAKLAAFPYLWLSSPVVRSLEFMPTVVWSVFLCVAMLHKCCDPLPCVDAFLLHPGSDPQISSPASSALGLSHAACLVRPQLTALGLNCWEWNGKRRQKRKKRRGREVSVLTFARPPYVRITLGHLYLSFRSFSQVCQVVTDELLSLSDSLWPHRLQHARLLCPPLTPRVCSDSCPLSQWCNLTF